MRGSFELREEIDHGGMRYFLQTSYVPNKEQIESSFFRNGVLFDTRTKAVEGKTSLEVLKSLSREVHNENKKSFLFILEIQDRIKDAVNPKQHLRLAQALFRRNLFTEAIREAQLTITNGDDSSIPLIVIGESYYRLGEYKKAFKALGEGIKLDPEYPDLHNLMGLIYLVERNCGKAIESFSRAIALNPYYGEPYLNLVRAYLLNTMVKEDYELSKDLEEKFRANVEKASHLYPFIQGDDLEEARRRFSERDYKGTLEQLDLISATSKRDGVEDIFLDLYFSVLYKGNSLEENDIERFLESVKQIIDQNPTYADGYNSLGVLYIAKCKILMDGASDAFQKALEINNRYQKAKKNLRLAENDRQGIFILLKALLD